ncbi:DUF423 domain-containing protein [Vibrio anguillarum]|uniref:DUF423 domain-containing protein n=1 Tax=Vibrio anguillarum TaxID=55601 RepID=UPI000BB4A4F8|nr:DUF423 domain-containing protein [Vibrio anguillarum]ATC57002.1 hypothetical protein CMV05_04680 [Vibrio anguillarum]MBF4249713.1 DUF423 domain-containing protein [Vibrio anguillarum]MBF4335099.1 DUF423 domain-containing protein [Vibrio anguillarum]MBF4388032.1 DUF423 domain-containing protein [Vibrio anguillarum]MBF4402346.1 DUF423 domain-containing protein [Vibrio anguillarum]
MKSKLLLTIAAFMAGVGVALGAFAAHGLKAYLTPYLLSVFETGVQYQSIHALAILACGILLRCRLGAKAQKYFFIAAICFIIGVLCFSGSLYALALTGIKWFGPITPFGGVFFMLGWGVFGYAALNIQEVDQ